MSLKSGSAARQRPLPFRAGALAAILFAMPNVGLCAASFVHCERGYGTDVIYRFTENSWSEWDDNNQTWLNHCAGGGCRFAPNFYSFGSDISPSDRREEWEVETVWRTNGNWTFHLKRTLLSSGKVTFDDEEVQSGHCEKVEDPSAGGSRLF